VNRRLLAAALAAATLAGGCSGGTSGNGTGGDAGATAHATVAVLPTAPQPPRVLVLGDSNLVASNSDVDGALRAAGFDPELHGVIRLGVKDLYFWLHGLDDFLTHDPKVVVIALGANDAVLASDAAAFARRLDTMMKEIGHRPVVWLTHHEGRPEPFGTNARTVNAAIRAAPARWPNLTVVDLAPELASDPTLLKGDALHFTPAGSQVFAAKIVEGVREALR
jgi:lysophospholipase L1-like esterase